MLEELYKAYWNNYLRSCNLPEREIGTPMIDELGDNPRTAYYLIHHVLAGRKTATCGLVEEYSRDNYPLPKIGDTKILIDGQRLPACIVEVIEVEIKPFSQIDESFAYDEGEGDRSYSFWRDEHVKCFSNSMRGMGKEFHEELLTVCERFKLLYK